MPKPKRRRLRSKTPPSAWEAATSEGVAAAYRRRWRGSVILHPVMVPPVSAAGLSVESFVMAALRGVAEGCSLTLSDQLRWNQQIAAAASGEVEFLRKRVADAQATHAAKVEDMEHRLAAADEEVRDLQTRLDAAEESLSDMTVLKRQLREVEASHCAQVKEFKTRLFEAQVASTSEVQVLEEKLDATETAHSTKVDQLAQRVASARGVIASEVAILKKQLDEATAAHTSECQAVTKSMAASSPLTGSQFAALRARVAAAEVAHNTEILAIQARFADAQSVSVAELTLSKKVLADTRATRTKEVEELKSQFTSVECVHSAESSELETRFRDTQATVTSEIGKLRKSFADSLARRSAEAEDLIHRLADARELTMSDVLTIKRRFAEAETAHRSRVSGLRHRFSEVVASTTSDALTVERRLSEAEGVHTTAVEDLRQRMSDAKVVTSAKADELKRCLAHAEADHVVTPPRRSTRKSRSASMTPTASPTDSPTKLDNFALEGLELEGLASSGRICDACGAPLPIAARFCDQCGKKLSDSGSRSQTPHRDLGADVLSDVVIEGFRIGDHGLKSGERDWDDLRAMLASAIADKTPAPGVKREPGWESYWDASVGHTDSWNPTVKVSLSMVWCLQSNAASRFRNGGLVVALAREVKAGRVDPMAADFLVLKGAVARLRGGGTRYYTFDHRRAYALFLAGVRTCRLKIVLWGNAFDELASKAGVGMGIPISKLTLRRTPPHKRPVTTFPPPAVLEPQPQSPPVPPPPALLWREHQSQAGGVHMA